MKETALIFGAGKTGRGFAAHLAFLGGYDIVLIDKNMQLIAELKQAGQYDIQVIDDERKSGTIKLSAAYHIDDIAWHDDLLLTGLIFTSVFGNNLPDLATKLAVALGKRHAANQEQPLTIITCENLTGAAAILKQMVLKTLGTEKESWLEETVAFSESIIFRTCLDAGANQSPLTVRAQNFFELPCDGDAINDELHVHGLKPLKNFGNQLRRKIYTYNCINAVITYLGAKKGYTQLNEAASDEEILAIARKAANESSRAQAAEFGFDAREQEEWTKAAFAKFADKNIPDAIERNGADPARKLGRDDRLVGPALLALKHSIQPEGLLEGIIACFDYTDLNTNLKIADLIKEKGENSVLKEICGVSEDEELFRLIKERISKRKAE